MLFPCARIVVELFCTKQRKSLVGIVLRLDLEGFRSSGNYITPENSGRAYTGKIVTLHLTFSVRSPATGSEKLESVDSGDLGINDITSSRVGAVIWPVVNSA